jgi:hypothetical protein
MSDFEADGDPRKRWRRRGVIGAIGTFAAGGTAIAQGAGERSDLAGQAGDAGGPISQRAARGAVRRSLMSRLEELPLTPEDFGAIGDGEADDSSAFEAAIAEAVRRRNATVWLTGGRSYRITTTLKLPQGVAVVGPGSQGSSSGYGCSIVHHSNGDLFVWDGTGQAFAGTGGGLRNVLIVKPPPYEGGTAISLIATSDSHRPGETVFENVLVYGESSGDRQGLWDHGLRIDGTAADTDGARGVRSTRCIGCRFAGVKVAGQTILLRQVTHAYFLGCAIDVGRGAARGGVTIEGVSDNVHFVAAGIAGDVLIGIDGSGSVANFHFAGKIGGHFINEDPTATGSLVASFSPTGQVLQNRSRGLRTVTNIDPAFRLVRRNQASLALSAEPSTIGWDAEVHDRGNNIQVPTGPYRCLNAGLHRFAAGVVVTAQVEGEIVLSFVISRAGGGSELVSVAGRAIAGQRATVSHAATIDLDFGDSVSIALSADPGGSVQLMGWSDRTGLGSWFECEM